MTRLELLINLATVGRSSFAWGYLGKLYEDERRYAEALDVTQQAILMGQQAAAPEALYRWHWQAGRLLKGARTA